MNPPVYTMIWTAMRLHRFLVLILEDVSGDWVWVFQGLPCIIPIPNRIALHEEQALGVAIQAEVEWLKETLEMQLVEEARQCKEDIECFFASFSLSGETLFSNTVGPCNYRMYRYTFV